MTSLEALAGLGMLTMVILGIIYKALDRYKFQPLEQELDNTTAKAERNETKLAKMNQNLYGDDDLNDEGILVEIRDRLEHIDNNQQKIIIALRRSDAVNGEFSSHNFRGENSDD